MDADVLVLGPDETGWLSSGVAAVSAGRPVRVVVTGKTAADIVTSMQRTVAALPLGGIMRAVTRHFPVAGKLPFDPLVAVPTLAAIGALGGAAGSLAFLVGVAVAHGVQPEFTFSPGAVFDLSDDTLSVLLPAPPARTGVAP